MNISISLGILLGIATPEASIPAGNLRNTSDIPVLNTSGEYILGV